MNPTTTSRADTVASVLREALDMRISDLRRSNGGGLYDIVRAKPGRQVRCTSCGARFGRATTMMRAHYATVAYCRTVYVEIVECPACALEAVLSDETGVATRGWAR